MNPETGKQDASNGVTICDPKADTPADISADISDEKTVEATGVISTGEDKKENGIQEDKTQEAEVPTKSVDLTVFVGKLSDVVTPEELKKFFILEKKLQETEVLGVNMPWKVVKKSKKLGIAFVDFANKQAYEMALTLNNSQFFGQNILVLPASNTHQGLMLMDNSEESEAKPNYVPVYKMSDHVAYIKNLPNGVNEDQVLSFFKLTRADVVDIAIPVPFKAKKNAKRPVRAIIAFPTDEALQKCLAMTKTTFREREVIVERHQMVSRVPVGEKRPATDAKDGTEASNEKQTRTAGEPSGQMELDLFVKHIPREATDTQIRDFFGSVAATVLKVNLFSESVTGSTRGMGFVSMADKESVQKGLLLDSKRFFKNKVRISVRRDREHLDRPDKGEVQPKFSTFIGNLPTKESAESLKDALTKHFEAAKCSVKNVYIPMAGNKGYALIEFENEDSLKKGQGLNNSEMTVSNTKISLAVSDRWPENPTETTEKDKAKENNAQQGTANARLDKFRKNKKGFPLSGGPSGGPAGRGPAPFGPRGPFRPNGPPRSMGNRGYGQNMPQNPWIVPPAIQTERPQSGPYGPEYHDYLEYLEYRDYVAMRKAYDERRELAEYRARYQQERNEEFGPPPQPPVAPPPLLSAQGPMGPGGYSRPLGGLRKEGHMDDEYRGSSAYGRRDHGSYDDVPPEPASGSRSRDYRDFDYVDSHGPGDGFKNTGPGNAGNCGYSGGGRGDDCSFPSDQRGPGGYNYSDSFSSSLNSSRYQTAADSFSRGRLFDTSAGGSDALGFSRDGTTAYCDSADGVNSSNRGGGQSKYGSNYPSGGGGDIRGSHQSASGASRSTGFDSGRSQYGPMSQSGHDRASSYSGGRGDTSGFGGSTGGSYSNSSMPPMQGDRLRFSNYPASGDLFEQYRKGSQYDKLNSSASRSGPSGASNFGYDGFSGHNRFRDV